MPLAEIKGGEGQVIAGAIFVLLPQGFDLPGRLLRLLQARGGLGEGDKRIGLAGLLLQHALRVRAGFLTRPQGEFGQAQFQLKLGIIGGQFRRLAQVGKRLRQPPLLLANNAQMTYGG